MRIELPDNMQVEVEFIHSPSQDPDVTAVKEERRILYQSEHDQDDTIPRNALGTLRNLDLAVANLMKDRTPKTTCRLTVIAGEVVQRTATGVCVTKIGTGSFHTRRLIALNRALGKLWPATKKTGDDSDIDGETPIRIPIPDNRPFRKAVWAGLIVRGFHATKEPRVTKLKRRVREFKLCMGIKIKQGHLDRMKPNEECLIPYTLPPKIDIGVSTRCARCDVSFRPLEDESICAACFEIESRKQKVFNANMDKLLNTYTVCIRCNVPLPRWSKEKFCAACFSS